MRNKVHVLAEGYSQTDSTDPECMRANCSCCLIQTHSGRNIIVDTMTAWDGEVIVEALQKLGLRCQDIHYVVCTHGHSDHIGCNYLFQNAEWHFVGTCKSRADKYPDCNWDEPFALDKDNVVIVSTPGHTLTCVSVVIYNADTSDYGGGTVGICGDLFEREEDVWQPDIWLGAGSENPQFQRENRYKMAEKCSIIIPGHGKGFQVTNEIRGEFGRYQAIQFFLQVLSALTAGLHMLSLVTVQAVPEHRCFIEGIDNSSFSYVPWNSSDILAAIPLKANGELDSCHMYDGHNDTVPCQSYVYDRTYYETSRTIDWNFVCDRRWMGSIVQTIFMLGVFTGAVTLGGLADKVGRKTVFCWSALLQLIIGVAVAFIPEYFSYMVARYLLGIFGSAGAYICGFVLTMELVGSTKRTVCGITFQAVFAGGIMLVAGWGALIKDRQFLQVIYGLHGALFLAHWWLLDESPRWLWMQGRSEEAVDIVAKGLRINKSGIAVDKDYFMQKAKAQQASEEKANAGLSDLFRTPNLRTKTLNVCLCWFANSLVYYGLSLSAGKLYGNPFLILFIMGLVEFPSYFTIVLVLDRLGRRPITSTLMIAGGLCCIVAAYIAQGSTTSTAIVMLGKLFIAGSFAVIYNYSAELFPTVVRNSAMGLGSMCARLSGALTPLITLLDSFDPKIPAVVFGLISLISGVWVMFLPETMNQPMPESIEDGENFGKGDTWFAQCAGRKSRRHSVYPEDPEQMVPLKNMAKK